MSLEMFTTSDITKAICRSCDKNENIKCPVKIAFMQINRIAPHIMYITGVTNVFIIPYLLYFFVFSDNATYIRQQRHCNIIILFLVIFMGTVKNQFQANYISIQICHFSHLI